MKYDDFAEMMETMKSEELDCIIAEHENDSDEEKEDEG